MTCRTCCTGYQGHRCQPTAEVQLPSAAQAPPSHYLVSWLSVCGAAAVQLRVKEGDDVFSHDFFLIVYHPSPNDGAHDLLGPI